jgi:adenosine deaminase
MNSILLATRIPKIHLHCHLEGALRASTFLELANKHGVPLRYRPKNARSAVLSEERSAESKGQGDTGSDAAVDPYRFSGLQEFLYLFAAVSRSLRDPEDYARLAREFVEDALGQNVIYGELFVSPSVWTFFNPELDVRAALASITAELRAARPRAIFRLLPDLTRNFGAENAMATARAVAAMQAVDIIGVSLGGDEARFPAKDFADAFAFARAQGLRCVAHAGESDGPHSVRDAVEVLGAERIGHGITALEDAATLALLAQRRVPVEICPTSNRLTGAALAHHPQPYADFDRAGCIVTIDCDDPAIFGASIGAEYELVERAAGAAALERYVRNAVTASFASIDEKRWMEAKISGTVSELPAPARS